MLTIALVIFALAAVGGLVLALHVLRDTFAPWFLSLAHAGLGAAGLIVLLLAVGNNEGGSVATYALVALVVAALGGFFLAAKHFKKEIPPKAIVFVHAGVAVAGVGLLLAAIFGG